MRKPKFKTGYYARVYRKYKQNYDPISKGFTDPTAGRLKNTFMPAQHLSED